MPPRVKDQPHLAQASLARHDGVRPALQARSQDKRDRLLHAGVAVFGELGYEAARVADIAAAAGLSVGVFYQRFKDKRSFFDALQSEFVSQATQFLTGFLARAPAAWTAEDVFLGLLQARARLVQENVGFFRGLVALSHVDPSVRPPALALDAATGAVLYAHLQARHLLPRGITTTRVQEALAIVTRALILTALVTPRKLDLEHSPLPRQLADMLAAYIGLPARTTAGTAGTSSGTAAGRKPRTGKRPARSRDVSRE
jgi:AcrR family transcriptional regulator